MATADTHFCLRVRNLPGLLSIEAITSLLSHYGATSVRVFQSRNALSSGKEPGAVTSKHVHKAIASFATDKAQQKAQKCLDSLELAGHYLKVEVIGAKATTALNKMIPDDMKTRDTKPLQIQPPYPKGLPPMPPSPSTLQNSLYTPAPLAPHLGLHYAPSPMLTYKYPRASEKIVRNIANALIALPRFYTQVLHLMNKMNLPPPFEEDAIPGIFTMKQDVTEQKSRAGDLRQEHVKRRRTDTNSMAQIVEEEEEDDVLDDHDAVREINSQTVNTNSPSLPIHQQGKHVSASRFRDSTPDNKPTCILRQDQFNMMGKVFTRRNQLSAIKKSTTLNTVFQLGISQDNRTIASRSSRPGVISQYEVNRLRLSREELMQVPLMKSYVRGFPSSSIMVKNIAHTVDEKDLYFVFGYVLPLNMSLESMTIKHLQAKGFALISYRDEAVATAAVDTLHGVQLEGKALIVAFNNSCDPSSDVAVVRWTRQDLDKKRLLETQLVSEKVMHNYHRGEPSDTLYVKNIARTVELADLFAIFGAVLPHESETDGLDIRYFTVGRMKCQAFVKYTTVQLASNALHQVHGVVIKDKPLIVCFRKSQTSQT